MRAYPLLAAWLWFAYEAWRDNGFKDIDADGAAFRPRPSGLWRVRPLKNNEKAIDGRQD